jgi:hypothetical protein
MPINTTVSQSTPQKGLVQPNNSGLSGLLGSIGSGISNFGSNLGKQFSGLVQLPGAMLNAGQAANIASNTQNAASGNAYIPNYGGQYSGQGITPNAAGATAKISSYPSANASSTLQTGTTKGIGSPSSLLNQNNSQSNSTSSGLVYPSPSLGLGTGGGAAPAGQEYGPTGQLQPKGTTSGLINPGTFNTNPYNASAPTYPGLVGALAGTASQPSAAFQQGQQEQQQLENEIQQSIANQTEANVANETNPIPIEFQQGRGQVLQTQYSNQQAALASQLQNALGQEQAGTSQQGTQQSGLAGAAGLAAPQNANALGTYSPTTGEYNGYGGTAGGSASGLQAGGNALGQVGIGQQVAQLNSSLGGAQVVGNNLQNLITQNNINPTGLTYANGALQFGQQALSNPAYQEFQGQINDFIASLAPILGAGGNVTDMKTQMSSQIVNALQSGQSINQVISYFLQQAQQKIQGLQQGGGVNTQSNATTGTNNQPVSGYSGWGATQ